MMESTVGGQQKNQFLKTRIELHCGGQFLVFLFFDFNIERRADMIEYTKQEAISIVTSCATKYEAELLDKSLLFVCRNTKTNTVHCYEFFFYASNYLHFTGLDYQDKPDATEDPSRAKRFFQKCLVHKLKLEEIEFSENGMTPFKLEILPKLMTKNLSAKIVGTYNMTKPFLRTEKLAGNVFGCVGFIQEENTKRYVPNTVLNEDIRDITTEQLQVVAVYRKPINELQYQENTYRAKKIDLSHFNFPTQYMYLQNL